MRHAPARCTLPSLCPNRADPGRCPVTLALTRTPALYPAAPEPARRTLLDVLAETAAKHPDEAAVDAGGTVLTYRELAEEIDAVRGRLTGAGIGVGDRVGVRISSGTAELYITILAVLSTGAAYVPVDADDPDGAGRARVRRGRGVRGARRRRIPEELPRTDGHDGHTRTR